MLKAIEAKKLVNELRDAVRQWDNWVPAPEQKAAFLNEGVKPVTDDLKDVIIECCEKFQVTEIDQPAWEITLAVDVFYAEFGRWATSMAAAPEAIHPGGSSEMWDAFRDILRVADKRRPPAPPSPNVLVSQGTTPRTAALRLGWYTPDGNPDVPRINRELSAKPEDQEYDPDSWVHPREQKFFEEIRVAFEKRNEQLAEVQERMKPRSVERTPCKESWESLFELPYMTLRQIAIMKMVTEDEARAKMEDFGYTTCVEGFRRAHEGGRIRRGDKEPEWLSQHDPHDECGDDITARVIACYRDGMIKPKSIADFLAGARNLPVTVQQAGKIIKQHKEAAAA